MFQEFSEDKKEKITISLLNLINSKFRVKNILYWKELGKTLCGVFNGSKIGLYHWKKITLDVENVEILEKILYNGDLYMRSQLCDIFYEDYIKNTKKCTILTIAFFAREDNPENYNKLRFQWMMEK